jgi:predicted DNA repair protein MutK
MKTLSVAGTAAMFLVGGSIIVHGVAPLEHLSASLASTGEATAPLLGSLSKMLFDAVVGVVAGAVVVGVVAVWQRIARLRGSQAAS